MTSNQELFQKDKSTKMEEMSSKLGFDIPVESVSLPSQGKIYSSEHPFCNAENAEVRSMTAREEDLLTSPALLKSGQVINKLVESCLLNKSVKADDLLIGDRNALLVAIRIIGYGSEYTTKIRCPECDEQFNYGFQLDNLSIKRLQVEPSEPNKNLFHMKLPLSKFDVTFKLMTCKEERELSDMEERKKKLGNQAENRITSRLAACIQSIKDINDKGKIANIISNLRAGDSRALRMYIDKIEPEINMTQEATCKHCGETSEVTVPIGASFFWPDFD